MVSIGTNTHAAGWADAGIEPVSLLRLGHKLETCDSCIIDQHPSHRINDEPAIIRAVDACKRI